MPTHIVHNGLTIEYVTAILVFYRFGKGKSGQNAQTRAAINKPKVKARSCPIASPPLAGKVHVGTQQSLPEPIDSGINDRLVLSGDRKKDDVHVTEHRRLARMRDSIHVAKSIILLSCCCCVFYFLITTPTNYYVLLLH